MICTQGIHDDMRSLAAVIDIADDMQVVDDKALNQIAECDNTFRCPADPDNRIDNFVIVKLFVLNFFFFGNQLFDDIGKIVGQRLAHLGAGIFGRNAFGHLHQPVNRDLEPILQHILILFLLTDQLQLFLRIINQRRKASFVLDTQRVAELLVDLSAHGSGAVFQHMVELLVFPVNIRQKMFRSFWQT